MSHMTHCALLQFHRYALIYTELQVLRNGLFRKKGITYWLPFFHCWGLHCRLIPTSLSQTLFALFNLCSTPSKEMTTEIMEGCCYLIPYVTHGKFFRCQSNFFILILVFPTSSVLRLQTTTVSAVK